MANKEPIFQSSKIVQVPVAKIKPYPGNAKVHSDAQVNELAKIIQEVGFTKPLLMTSKFILIAGHGALLAAKVLKMETVPAIFVDHLSDRQIRAYVIADNKIAEKSTWDMEQLSAEMDILIHEDYDLAFTGFNEQELDALLKSVPLIPDVSPLKTAEEIVDVKSHDRVKKKVRKFKCPHCGKKIELPE